MLNSFYRRLVPVALPFANRQMYMHTFDIANPKMADGFEDYLEPVRALCEASGVHEGVAHMTVDEKTVHAGCSQRRPRPHVDGCFIPSAMGWSHPSPGSWAHGNIRRMPVIVASNVSGCRAWTGDFDAVPDERGDLSAIEDQLGEGQVLPANVGYWLSPDCIHESMIFDETVNRSFLRIALPVM